MVPCPILQVQINQIDHYFSPPGHLDNSDLPSVPVIRIYGSSSTGKKCCVHVHQVYPYFFVEYIGKLRLRSVNRYITKLTHSLNHAIALSLKKDITFKPQFVRAICLVKGVHFYGFHSSYSPFLKVYIVNPAFFNRAVTIMRSGTVMGLHFRVFESHLNFTLQFMSDFGLYGCGWLDLSDVFQRGADCEDESAPEVEGSNSPSVFQTSPHFCQTRMPLEVDVAAFHILNRLRLTARNLHHKLDIPAPLLPPEPLVLSVRELWEDERNRRRARGLDPSPDMPVDPSESSRTPRGEWVAEARWWEGVRQRIENETGPIEALEPQNDWEKWVMTTFESVQALWEEPWRTWKPTTSVDYPEVDAESAVDEEEHQDYDIDVDTSLFSDDHLSQLVEREAEWERSLDHDVPPEEYSEDADVDPLQEDQQSPQTDNGHVAESQSPISPLEDVFSSNVPTTPSDGLPLFSSPPDLDLVADFEDPTTPTRSGKSGEMQLMDSPLDSPVDSPREEISPLVLPRKLPPTNDAGTSCDDPDTSPPHKKRRTAYSNNPSAQSAHAVSHRAMGMITQQHKTINLNRYAYAPTPPSISQLLETVVPSKQYRPAFYSNDSDAPGRPREYGGKLHHPKGNEESLKNLDDWEEYDACLSPPKDAFDEYSVPYSSGWEYIGSPPSVKQVKKYLASEEGRAPLKKPRLEPRSQIEGPTQANIYGLETTPGVTAAATSREKQRMTVFVLEVFACSAQAPSPEFDEIVAAFYSFEGVDSDSCCSGMIIVDAPKPSFRNSKIDIVSTELDLLNQVVDMVVDLDPDIVVGWEIQAASWGYLNGRGHHYGLDVADLVSRAPSKRTGGNDQWGLRHTSTFKVAGRHVLNLWRIMRVEQTLNIYTFENVVFHVLKRRIPLYSPATLTEWYRDSIPAHTATVLRYFSSRTSMALELLEETDVIAKTAEFARVFGVDFFSVISRGSQFKVESFMFRIAKPESLVLLSPSRQDVGRQNAAEAMPLIMEPDSGFYTSPVVVLDFQSLYPSLMIAYNYCYSTFLGRVNDFQGHQKFGVTELDLRPGLVKTLYDHINVTPTGMMFVKPEVRKGLLGRMLVELLETRVMVKQAMKGAKDDKALSKILNARQLSLKYIANVTYGYTSATFSGRMPAVEIADSIVQSGRETLEKAIRTIDSTKKWGARVVYGDTDSVFVHMEGKTKDQAFRIGHEIANFITASNPAPVKLKFEKVYLPCVLLAKKRYVGFKYENPDDLEPVFDAKGIETVRRDGCGAQRKMTETSLKILFRTQDLSEIKEYCYRSWQKLAENKAPIQDFIFAKEVKLGTYSDKGPPPPGAVVAARQAILENIEPQYSERVPYVICRGAPKSRLVDRGKDPLEVLRSRHLQLDAEYYISRVLVPPLDRILSLAGADVRRWYLDMPKGKSLDVEVVSPSKLQKQLDDNFNIDGHFLNPSCLVCGGSSREDICDECYLDQPSAMSTMLSKIQMGERRLLDIHRTCATCTQTPLAEPVKCESLDCSWLYARTKTERKLDFLVTLRSLLSSSISE
ncbi:hypothetical protein B0H17DRAFT_1035991 [Mycena rosella]|uniref:DNA polymerase n=1 Tax=Mycena rosella TaxID=1033263 RepID=A0AAD7GVH8_MYCRO|nr:hypothetical protein B0H17DRAFT_1035991 [Mycena rosella]